MENENLWSFVLTSSQISMLSVAICSRVQNDNLSEEKQNELMELNDYLLNNGTKMK